MADNIPKDLKYTKEHEWALQRGNVVRIGITDHAQASLGDVVFLELPKVGDMIEAGEECGSIESTKAVSSLFAPLTGKVVTVNQEAVEDPELINTEPYGDGWLIEIEPSDSKQLADLLDAGAYQELLK